MTDNGQRLYRTAEAQQGYFTYRQALQAGYSSPSLVYHVSTGAWVREYRGLYRLARFPVSPDGHYVLWTLWSCSRDGEPQGVYTHQTALSIHELSDVMPAKLHMTVPPSFRRNAAIPKVIVLHKSDVSPVEVEQRQGYRVVRPLRAVAELLRDGTESRDRLQQALSDGLRRGIIARTELEAHPDRKALARLLKGRAA
jgi:predicted transcriptional regulator of viral defense system